MNRYFKVLITFILMFCITIIDILNCSAHNTVYSSANVPSQAKSDSRFTIQLGAQSDIPVGTIIFTFEYSDNIEYVKSKVNDNDNGYIIESNKSGIINITYVNTAGIDLSKKEELIEITMKSGDEAKSWIEVSTSYSTSIDEKVLSDDNKIHYNMSIVKNVTDKSLADGVTISKKSLESTDKNKTNTSKNSGNNKSTPDRNNSKNNNDKNTESATENSLVSILSDDENTKLFLAGGVFAISIFAVLIVSYFMGKKHSNKKGSDELNNN